MLTFRENVELVYQALRTNAEYLQVPVTSIQKGTLFDTPASAPYIILFAELSDKYEATLDTGKKVKSQEFIIGCSGAPAASQPDTHANTVELSERIAKILYGTLDDVIDLRANDDAVFVDSTSIVIEFIAPYKPSV